MTLTEKWETCPTCGGSAKSDHAWIVGTSAATHGVGSVEFDPCHDCVDGLVPPEGMVRAAADEFWDLNFIRRILVAAKRWEKEQ